MLRYFLFPRLRDFLQSNIFKHNSAFTDYPNEERQYLDTKLPEQWMERGGTISWPSRSPDLILCEYFPKKQSKDIVHCDSLRTVDELKTKIRYGIQAIN